MAKFHGLSTEFNLWMDTRFGKNWSKEIDFTTVTHYKNAFFFGASITIQAIRAHIGRPHYVRVENEIITDIEEYAILMKQRAAKRNNPEA